MARAAYITNTIDNGLHLHEHMIKYTAPAVAVMGLQIKYCWEPYKSLGERFDFHRHTNDKIKLL